MALSTWAQLLAGCKTWTGEKPDKPEMPDKIVSLPDIQDVFGALDDLTKEARSAYYSQIK